MIGIGYTAIKISRGGKFAVGEILVTAPYDGAELGSVTETDAAGIRTGILRR